MKIVTYIKIGIALVVVVLLVAGFFWLRSATEGDHISFGADNHIELTPTQIQSMKAIGEWEFLSVSAEELVDTVRKGIFKDDELVRIYYGTLRLGLNMHRLQKGWIKAEGDRDALYKKAYRQMMSHGMTQENLQAAEHNAEEQLRQMMRSMGFTNVRIRFEE